MSKSEQPTDASLVPLIRAEEARLAETLEQTKNQALESIAEARRQADARIEAMRQRMPAVIAETRAKEIQNLDTLIKEHEAQGQVSITALERQARANMPATIDKILSLVLPEGTA